ncbi:extracellular solute-binding protein [Paenibacillus sp.]|uniref:extracellular solute-binding protein n=1 Tax=Paenibacillus sp. TaxID=58172 RepID=UPI002D731E57|nr:extracellular solute-binding protein [Paenibacillus sp.]HZG84096.1 extracellular solute-binding protein [Paenibacillus sp.]
MRKKAAKTLAVPMMAAALMLSACTNNGAGSNEGGTNPEPSAANQGGEQSASEGTKEELVTLRVLVMETGTKWNKYPDSAVAKDIAEKIGVKIEYVEADENKFNVLLAGGDLPDIVRADVNKFEKQLIEGDLIIPMDDMLAEHGKDITANIGTVVEYSKKNWSNDTGKLYFLPPQVQPKPGTAISPITIGPTIRWDWYKEIGAPEINTMDDLLNAVEQIVKNHPKTEDGKPVYGVSMWQDWGLWPYLIPPITFTELTGVTSDLTATTVGGSKFISTLTDESSNFWTAMEFYNKAHRRGLLDPDSLTMKNNDYMAKATAGQIVVGPATWAMGDFNAQHPEGDQGYIVVPAGKLAWTGGVNPLGWQDKTYAISKSSKHPEKAMQFLNYIYSYEGARTMYNGVEGTHWTMVDGKPTLTEETLALKAKGGTDFEASALSLDRNLIGLGNAVINANDNQPVDLFTSEEALAKAATPLEKDFAAHYGAEYSGQVFKKLIEEGKLNTWTTWMNGMSDDEILKRNTVPGVTLTEEQKKTEAALKELAARQAAKIILSKDEAEFEKNKQEAIEAFKKGGAEEFTKFYNEEVAKLRAAHGLTD